MTAARRSSTKEDRAATDIQRVFRGRRARTQLLEAERAEEARRQRIEAKHEKERAAAAVKLQAMARGRRDRKRVQDVRANMLMSPPAGTAVSSTNSNMTTIIYSDSDREVQAVNELRTIRE